jgi:hypothetical protein
MFIIVTFRCGPYAIQILYCQTNENFTIMNYTLQDTDCFNLKFKSN